MLYVKSILSRDLMKPRFWKARRRLLKVIDTVLCTVLIGFLVGCVAEDSDKVTVVTTTTHVTDMVREIGGSEIVLLGLMGPGVDPHLYKPSAGDVAKLRKADVIFYSGLMLEGRMADLFLENRP